jgi:peptidoglycan-associated lipoprotein
MNRTPAAVRTVPLSRLGPEPNQEGGMRLRLWHGVVLTLLFMALMAVGCAKRPATTVAAAPSPSGTPAPAAALTAPAPTTPDSAGGDRQTPPTAATSRSATGDFAPVADLRDVHFDFDTHDFRPREAKILETNARWLKAHPSYVVLIEGHCDERGTNEYNLALGERRAKSTVNFLVSRGVAASRLNTVSYGEERPACTEKTKRCWAANRRAHFLGKAS